MNHADFVNGFDAAKLVENGELARILGVMAEITGHKIEDDTDDRIDKAVITIFGCGIFSCFMFFLFQNKWPAFNLHNLPVLLFSYLMVGAPVFPTIQLLWILYRLRKHGIAILDLDQLPVKLGGAAVGKITIPKRVKDFSSFNLNVSCHKLVDAGKSSRNILLWESSQSINPDSIHLGEAQTIIPVRFFIPADCVSSKINPPKLLKYPYPSEIRWQLEVNATPLSGMRFDSMFFSPVSASQTDK